jgi:hypothetical protein
MNLLRLRCLIGLGGCLGCAALAGQSTESPTRALEESYQFHPQAIADPSIGLAAEPVAITTMAGSNDRPKKPDDYDLRGLAEAIAQAKRRRAETLFTWNLPDNTQLSAIGRPDFQALEIPWSPMISTANISASSKVQVRIPALSAVW